MSKSYISWGRDNQKLFSGKSPLEKYKDFMIQFKNRYMSIPRFITSIKIGLGPDGDLKYPAFEGEWKPYNKGEFYFYDASLKESLSQNGMVPPTDSGGPNVFASDTAFWGWNGFSEDYGKNLLHWSSWNLINHGRSIMSLARSVFGNTKLVFSLAGVDWMVQGDFYSKRRPAECAGIFLFSFILFPRKISKIFCL